MPSGLLVADMSVPVHIKCNNELHMVWIPFYEFFSWCIFFSILVEGPAGVNTDIPGISELDGLEWGNLTQITIISTTAGRNPSEEME